MARPRIRSLFATSTLLLGSTLGVSAPDDDERPHMRIDLCESDCDGAVTALRESGEHVWFAATVVIDDAVYESAGVRLDAAASDPEDGTLAWEVRLDKWVAGASHDGTSALRAVT